MPSRGREYNLTLESEIKKELGSNLLQIDHVGSTAVPGLSAKPVIDIALTVNDAEDETTYVLALESLGYKLIVREPRFHSHRFFTIIIIELTYIPLLWIHLKQPESFFFEIGLDNQG